MPEFNCGACGRLLKTPAGTEGKKGKCPHCKAVMSIPTDGSGASVVQPSSSQPGSPSSDSPALDTPRPLPPRVKSKPTTPSRPLQPENATPQPVTPDQPAGNQTGPAQPTGSQPKPAQANPARPSPAQPKPVQPANPTQPAAAAWSTSPYGQPAGQARDPFGNQVPNPYASPGQPRPHGFQQQPARHQHGVPHRGSIVLVLGIISLIMSLPALLCFCLWPISIPSSLLSIGLAIPAFMMGGADLKKMNSNLMDRSGYGMTNAGFIMGIVGGVLSLLALIGLAGFMVYFFFVESGNL